MNKKAQVKFGEAIGVIIIVYIILMSGLIWYNNINTKSLNDMYKKDQLERAFEKYYYLVNLDMLHVSQRGNVDDEFDLDSIHAFANFTKTSQGNEFFRKKLGESVIKLRLYNYTSIDSFISYQNLTLYNNTPKDNNGRNYDMTVFKTLIPVVDDVNSRGDIGVLEIYVYIQKR